MRFMKEKKAIVPAQKDWYQWVIYALCFAMGFITLGFCSSNSGLYLTAITKALGMSRAAFSMRNVLRYGATSVLNLFFGAMVARFGEKKMACAGVICLIGAVLSAAWAQGPALIYLSGLLLGVGFIGCGTTMISYIIGRWCRKNKGTITGIVLSANGFGGALAAQIVTPIIYDESNVFGYRNAYYLITALLAALLIAILVLLKEPPKQLGEAAKDEGREKRRQAVSWKGISYRELSGKPFFYLTLITMFCASFSLQTGVDNLSPHMTDQGVDAEFIALVLSVHSLVILGSKILSGVLFDKIGLRKTMFICQMSILLSICAMLLVSATPLGYGMAMVSGIVGALGKPVLTVMISLLVLGMFGECSYAKLVGICSSVSTAGTAVASYIANLAYDLCGSYTPILIFQAIVMLAVVIVFQFCMNASDKMRKQIETKDIPCQKENNNSRVIK